MFVVSVFVGRTGDGTCVTVIWDVEDPPLAGREASMAFIWTASEKKRYAETGCGGSAEPSRAVPSRNGAGSIRSQSKLQNNGVLNQ